MKRALVVMTIALAACGTPPLTIRFELTDGDSQQCFAPGNGNPTTSCSDLPLACEAYLSIRIVPPSTPQESYVRVCEPLSKTARNLCSIAGIPLPQPAKPIPEQILEVQVAVFPKEAITLDEDGQPRCPLVEYGVNGLPLEAVDCGGNPCPQRPAVGGRAFYHPGDEETVVELGCPELRLLNGEMCAGITHTEVTATVNEFEFPSSVDLATAGGLFVSLGEPSAGPSGSYFFDSAKAHLLPRNLAASLPTWGDTFADLGFTDSFCIEVLEQTALATRALTCRRLPASYPDSLDSSGTRLKAETLSTILKALYGTTPSFPAKGLVVGIVLNDQFLPVANAVVRAPSCEPPMGSCTIKYLSADKQSFTTGASAATSANGIWVSEDAPYGTLFSRSSGSVTDVFGGLVDGKVTIVVLQDPSIGGM